MKSPFASRWLQPVVLLAALMPMTGFAMVCTTLDSGETAIHGDLASTVAIPVSLPNGDIVWRSELLGIQVECARDEASSGPEEVFLHLNPDDVAIGQGIRAGVTLNGIDYVQSSGHIGTGAYLAACQEAETSVDLCPKSRFNLAFSVFIQKFGATPPSGVASDLFDYRFFELGGLAGTSRLPGRTLSYVINNLTGLRFVACNAELLVLPETVDFGDLAIQQSAVGKVFATRMFSLLTSRTCDSPFSINARFRPVTGRVSGDVLIPANNDSLGIRIVSVVSGSPLRYNEPFHLADLLGATHTARADFNAQLLWNASRPRTGPFEAEVMVDLFYK